MCLLAVCMHIYIHLDVCKHADHLHTYIHRYLRTHAHAPIASTCSVDVTPFLWLCSSPKERGFYLITPRCYFNRKESKQCAGDPTPICGAVCLSFRPLLPTEALCGPRCIGSFTAASTYRFQGKKMHSAHPSQWELVVGFQGAMKETGNGFGSLGQAGLIENQLTSLDTEVALGPRQKLSMVQRSQCGSGHLVQPLLWALGPQPILHHPAAPSDLPPPHSAPQAGSASALVLSSG